MPTPAAPARLTANVTSANVVPSVAFAKTNVRPEPAAASQSISRCQFETSIPDGAAAVRPTAGSTRATSTSAGTSRRSGARRRLSLGATTRMATATVEQACSEDVWGAC